MALKTRAKIRWHERADGLGSTEYPITNPRDEIVADVAQPSRHSRHRNGDGPPHAAEAPESVEDGIGPDQQLSIFRSYRDAVRRNVAFWRYDQRRILRSPSIAVPKREPYARAGV